MARKVKSSIKSSPSLLNLTAEFRDFGDRMVGDRKKVEMVHCYKVIQNGRMLPPPLFASNAYASTCLSLPHMYPSVHTRFRMLRSCHSRPTPPLVYDILINDTHVMQMCNAW